MARAQMVSVATSGEEPAGRLERRRGFPVPHLKRIEDGIFAAIIRDHALHAMAGHGRHCVDLVEKRRGLVQHPLCAVVLAALQVGIEQEVVGVRLVHDAAAIFCLRGF